MLMQRERSLLLIVDMQERLAPAIADDAAIIARTGLLLKAATRLDLPIVLSEQYPRGIGHTDPRLGTLPQQAVILEKTHFSLMREPGAAERIAALDRRQVVVAGMETHVCVLATALDLVAAGYEVFIAADATGSRRVERRRLGLDRMRDGGCIVADSEMTLFEWLGRSATPEFRELIGLIKES